MTTNADPSRRARVRKPQKQRLEVFILPSARHSAQVRAIRRAGGDIPERLQPKSVGVHDLGMSVSTVQARERATVKAAEAAERYKCTIRSVSLGQRGWVASLVKKDK